MYKATIISPGKLSSSGLLGAISEYEKRLKPFLKIEWILKDKQPTTPYICIDATGKVMNSMSFAHFILNQFEMRQCRLTFVIGGAEGISKNILDNASWIISLSKLTFTHQMARLIFIEQLYRTIEIQKGSKYNK